MLFFKELEEEIKNKEDKKNKEWARLSLIIFPIYRLELLFNYFNYINSNRSD